MAGYILILSDTDADDIENSYRDIASTFTIFITNGVVDTTTMSLQEGLVEGETQSGHGDTSSGSPESLAIAENYSGLTGRIRRHFDIWARKYIDMRVEARTGRRN